MHFSKSLQGSKGAITVRPVSIELTLLLFLQIYNIVGSSYHCVKSVQIRNFFWSIFFCIWTEYGDLLCKYPYSVRIQENMDQKNFIFGYFSGSELSLRLILWNYKHLCYNNFLFEMYLSAKMLSLHWCELFYLFFLGLS